MKKIAIVGTVSVGKSAVVNELEKKFGDRAYINYENVQNDPFLKKLYDDPKKWSFFAQYSFLIERIRRHLVADEEAKESNKEFVVHDRIFIEDQLFVQNFFENNQLTVAEFHIYNSIIYEFLTRYIKEEKMDLIILLKTDIDTIVERITNRDRNIETDVDKQYWSTLWNIYYDNKNAITSFKNYAKVFVIIDNTKKSPIEVADEIIQMIDK